MQEAEESLACPRCHAVFPVVQGIPLMFPPDSANSVDSVVTLYDEVAPDYDQSLPAHIVEHYLRRRIDLIRACCSSGRLLDVGCGTGRLAARLVQTGYDVVGLDASPGMLRIMAANGRGKPVGGHGDALPFPDDSFDVVVSVATLHHIAEASRVAATISEMYRVVRPHGAVVIWDHNPLNPYWPSLMARVPQDSGEERLIPLEEIMGTVSKLRAKSIEVRRMGFTPEFIPPRLLRIWTILESMAERVPLLRNLAAHNVVVARKASHG